MNTYGEISNATAGWYSRRLLSHAVPVIILERYALMKTMPRNETKVMQFRRSLPFTPATTPLAEGVTPESHDFGYDTISVQIQQYGDWSQISDVVDDTSKDNVLSDIVQRQGEQIAETHELLTWDIIRVGTNVAYGGGKTARTGVDKTSEITASGHRSMIAEMHRQKGKMYTTVVGGSTDYATYSVEASYVFVGHTDLNPSIRELKGASDTPHNAFTPVSRYGNMSPTSPRELGAFEDGRYVTSPDLPPWKAAGATAQAGDRPAWRNSGTGNKYDVYPILMFAREAFGCIGLRGRTSVRPMVLQPNVPRAGDELGQRGSAGWKSWFACKVLNEAWLRRFETVARK